MLIGHFSDLHGDLRPLLGAAIQPDVWLNTGDFFPDDPMGPFGPVQTTRAYQKKWFWRNRDAFLRALKGVPLITCPGNHDVHSLHKLLEHLHPIHEVSPAGLDLLGLRWAGFGFTPLDTPQMVLGALVAATLEADPQVLVTHAPPTGILCAHGPGWGIADLPRALGSQTHRVAAHFFGHVHQDGGRDELVGTTRHYNGARRLRYVDSAEFGL